MLARLLLGPAIDKIGYTKSIIVLSLLAGGTSLLGIVFGEQGAILFAIAGIGVGPIYPTVMALLAKRYKRGTGTAITFTVSLMGVASVLGNLFTGWIIEFVSEVSYPIVAESHILGLHAGYGFLALSALLCAICGIALYLFLKKKNEVIH